MATTRKVKAKKTSRVAARKWCKVTVVLGPGGHALYVNDVRVYGQKPWGGGRVLLDLRPLVVDVRAALRGPKVCPPPSRAWPCDAAPA